MFDKDNSGTISADEIRQVLGSDTTMSIQSINDMIKEVDENGDGEI